MSISCSKLKSSKRVRKWKRLSLEDLCTCVVWCQTEKKNKSRSKNTITIFFMWGLISAHRRNCWPVPVLTKEYWVWPMCGKVFKCVGSTHWPDWPSRRRYPQNWKSLQLLLGLEAQWGSKQNYYVHCTHCSYWFYVKFQRLRFQLTSVSWLQPVNFSGPCFVGSLRRQRTARVK